MSCCCWFGVYLLLSLSLCFCVSELLCCCALLLRVFCVEFVFLCLGGVFVSVCCCRVFLCCGIYVFLCVRFVPVSVVCCLIVHFVCCVSGSMCLCVVVSLFVCFCLFDVYVSLCCFVSFVL